MGEVADSSALCATVYRNGKCVCTYDQFYQPNMRNCLKTVAQINDFCTAESQCTPFGEAHCSVGATKRCLCLDYAYLDEAQQLCVKRVGLRQFCAKSEDCGDVPNTDCNTETNSCVCKANYYEEDEKCKPGVGAPCNSVADCGVVNTECDAGEGTSAARGIRVEEDPFRRHVPDTIQEELEIEVDGDDEETGLIGGLELAGRRKRLRKQSTVVAVATVKKSVSPSSSSSASIVSVLSPRKVEKDEVKTCRCKEGFVAKNNECLEKAKAYGEECEATEQCTPLLGDLAECDAGGQCVCKDEAHYHYNKCNKKVQLGETCTRVSECFVEEGKEEVQCRNAKCQCGFNSVMDVEQRKCVTVASKSE